MSAIRGIRVLFVEDNEIHQTLLLELLSKANTKPVLAENGAQAINILAEQSFDLVLMDCQMPIMDGIEATKRIRQQPQWASLPIIALTATTDHAQTQQALAAGMNAIASKPVEPQQFYQLLYQWLPQPAQADDLQEYLDKVRVKAHAQQLQQPIQELLTQFTGVCVPKVMALKKAAASQQSGALQDAARQIQQVISHLAHPDFTGLAQELVEQADRLSSEQVESHCQRLVKGVQQLIKEIRRWQQTIELEQATDNEAAQIETLSIEAMSIDGLDGEAGLQRCGGNPKVYVDLLRKFADMYGDGLQSQGDELAAYVHGMKGAAAYLGVTCIADVAIAIEQDLASNQPPTTEQLNRASTTVVSVCQQIREQLSSN
ncbi:hypothetical protein GCM10011369_17450 [Neiella marina]|uniref:Response regulatory domain-containing protein n=2 Tax=Neiella marina TaxID=508461 RepID=A0A8J2XPE1_9GAMM|nr:hypothetical protein GCM10011369_17450 [Neiella marina]